MIRPPPISTLFPYPALFRSRRDAEGVADQLRAGRLRRAAAHLAGHLRDARRLGHPPEPRLRRGPRPPQPLLRARSEEHTSELQSRQYLVCRLLLEKKKIRWL